MLERADGEREGIEVSERTPAPLARDFVSPGEILTRGEVDKKASSHCSGMSIPAGALELTIFN